jgi:hypothetical protein
MDTCNDSTSYTTNWRAEFVRTFTKMGKLAFHSGIAATRVTSVNNGKHEE